MNSLPPSLRAAAMALGAVIALGALLPFYQTRREAEAIGIDEESLPRLAVYDDTRLNVWQIDEYPTIYPAEQDDPAEREALWLGNSQLHTINQPTDGDSTAVQYASEALGCRVYGVSLNNANLQEHLVVLQWAIERRRFDWLILAVCYDDLREDGIRGELEILATPEVSAMLAKGEVGTRLAAEIEALRQEATDAQGTARTETSLQDRTEAVLEERLGEAWDLWAQRSDILGTMKYKLYQFRNWTFGISATSKRRMIPLRLEKNIAALVEMLDVAKGNGLNVLVYNVPLRWDIEPPYELEAYRQWKRDAGDLTRDKGVTFLDLDELVPDSEWGLHHGDKVDFMHFQVQGHRLLGQRIADELKQRLARKAAE